MTRTLSFAAVALALALPGAAHADHYMEVEAARANARAGGPISDRDAELLERYGCVSGSRSSFCQRLSARDRTPYRVERRRVRR